MIWGWLALFVGLFLLGGAYSFLTQKKDRPLIALMIILGVVAVGVGIWRLWVFDTTGT